jgi:ubiquinone/menaquinone biosynthesis C-methylase UbiE
MSTDNIVDVPSPIDLRDPGDAAEWAATAMTKRPWRTEFFARFAKELSGLPRRRALELGSGPGFLAEAILGSVQDVDYTLLDFSSAMHELATQRVAHLGEEKRFVCADFRDPNWTDGLPRFDAIVTLQAVHELRHKLRAVRMHQEVRRLLVLGGIYLVCDHYLGPGGMSNDQLYMTVAEQRSCLERAGFTSVRELMRQGGLVLHRAE